MTIASMPYRAARHLFSRTNQGCIWAGSCPWSSLVDMSSTRHWTSAAIDPTSSNVEMPSNTRVSSVPHFGEGRMSQRSSLWSSMTPVWVMFATISS
jgi:hypothetical protein